MILRFMLAAVLSHPFQSVLGKVMDLLFGKDDWQDYPSTAADPYDA